MKFCLGLEKRMELKGWQDCSRYCLFLSAFQAKSVTRSWLDLFVLGGSGKYSLVGESWFGMGDLRHRLIWWRMGYNLQDLSKRAR